MTEASRAEFEAWATEQGRSVGTLNGITYFDPFVGGLWQAWQAARASVVVELPVMAADKWGDRKYSAEQVKSAIIAAGASVK